MRTKVTKKQWRSSEGIIRRNQLERGRVESMNEAFDQLRQVVPYGEYKGKKSQNYKRYNLQCNIFRTYLIS